MEWVVLLLTLVVGALMWRLLWLDRMFQRLVAKTCGFEEHLAAVTKVTADAGDLLVTVAKKVYEE